MCPVRGDPPGPYIGDVPPVTQVCDAPRFNRGIFLVRDATPGGAIGDVPPHSQVCGGPHHFLQETYRILVYSVMLLRKLIPEMFRHKVMSEMILLLTGGNPQLYQFSDAPPCERIGDVPLSSQVCDAPHCF